MKKAYFQYYETFEKIVLKFKTEEEQNAFRSKIVNYGLFGIVPELNDMEDMVWDIIQDMVDDQTHRRQTNSENRKGKRRTEATGIESPASPSPASEEDDACEEKETLSDDSGISQKQEMTEDECPATPSEKKKTRFVKPSVAEIESYCRERGNSISPERFFDFYESKGWKVGSSPMKDWKACIRTWEQKKYGQPQIVTAGGLPADRLTL